MKQVELTSKLVLAIIGLTSVGGILIPTYAVPTIRSADIFDETILSADIKNGEVKNADLGGNAVTTDKILDHTIQSQDLASGVIPSGGSLQRVVRTDNEQVSPGQTFDLQINCESGEILTGGGYSKNSWIDLITLTSQPDENTWVVSGSNVDDTNPGSVTGYAICVSLTS